MTTSTTPTLDAERADLLDELATARASLVATTQGLTDEQASSRPTASALSVGALVKHVAGVEEGWQRFAVEGAAAQPYDLPEGVTWQDLVTGTAREFPQWAIDHQGGLQMRPDETLAGILERYEQVAARTTELLASIDLTTTHALPAVPWHRPGEVRSVRKVFLHLIAETAQHAGHADILRESIDGQVAG